MSLSELQHGAELFYRGKVIAGFFPSMKLNILGRVRLTLFRNKNT